MRMWKRYWTQCEPIHAQCAQQASWSRVRHMSSSVTCNRLYRLSDNTSSRIRLFVTSSHTHLKHFESKFGSGMVCMPLHLDTAKQRFFPLPQYVNLISRKAYSHVLSRCAQNAAAAKIRFQTPNLVVMRFRFCHRRNSCPRHRHSVQSQHASWVVEQNSPTSASVVHQVKMTLQHHQNI